MQRKYWYLILVIVLALGVGLTACGLQAQAGAETDTAKDVEALTATINEIYGQYASSLKSGDVDRWIALWSNEGVQMPPGSPPIIGTEEIGAGTLAFLDAFTVDSFEIYIDEVQLAGDLAFARGTYSGVYTPKDGGEGFAEDGKYLTVFQRQPDGSWKIHRDIFNLNTEGGTQEAEMEEGGTQEPKMADGIEDIAGTWHRLGLRSQEYYILYSKDGTLQCSHHLERLKDNPMCRGEFWFEGTKFFDKEIHGWCAAAGQDIGVYQIQLQANGNLKFTLIEDECGYRISDYVGLYSADSVSVEYEPVP